MREMKDVQRWMLGQETAPDTCAEQLPVNQQWPYLSPSVSLPLLCLLCSSAVVQLELHRIVAIDQPGYSQPICTSH